MAFSRYVRRSFVISHRFRLGSLMIGALLLAELLLVVDVGAALSIKLPPLPLPKWFYNGTYASPLCETTFRCDTSSRNGTLPACSCHPNCSLYDACCEDVRPSDWRQRVLPPDAYECAVYPILGTDSQGNIKTVIAASFVFLITKCPSSYTGSCLARLCDSPTDDAGDDKLHFTWVSDRLTGVTYKNKFCALCHGLTEDKMEYWSQSYGCIDNPVMDKFGLTGCEHNVLLRDDIEIEVPRCYGPYYSRCSNGSSQQQQEACTDSPARFFYDYVDFVTYRNYNCSLCNSLSRSTSSQCTRYAVYFALPLMIDATLVSVASGCLREQMACDAEEEPQFIKGLCKATAMVTDGLRLREATTGASTTPAEVQHSGTFYPALGMASGSTRLLRLALPVYVLSMLVLASQ